MVPMSLDDPEGDVWVNTCSEFFGRTHAAKSSFRLRKEVPKFYGLSKVASKTLTTANGAKDGVLTTRCPCG